jgi:3-oxoacid CoA-transferase subunit B
MRDEHRRRLRDGERCIAQPLILPVVQRIITDLAVIDVTAEGLELIEVAPGVTKRDVKRATEPDLL